MADCFGRLLLWAAARTWQKPRNVLLKLWNNRYDPSWPNPFSNLARIMPNLAPAEECHEMACTLDHHSGLGAHSVTAEAEATKTR